MQKHFIQHLDIKDSRSKNAGHPSNKLAPQSII